MVTRAYRSPRREQAAAETRTAILDAAEKLFAANGYAATTVNEVAAAATVGPNTVYTSVGGKPQLVVALIERAAADPLISASLDTMDTLTDGPEIIRLLAADTSAARRGRQATVAVMLDNLTTDPLIAEAAERASALVRRRLRRIATRLTAIQALRDGTTTSRAAAILWFYFGFAPWRELRSLGWTWKETERWLAEQAIGALIGPSE